MDAISALFPFHDEFLQKVKDFVKEKMSTATDNIKDFDQKLNNNIKIKEEIHTLHKNQHLCIDNLKTMLYLEAGKLDSIQWVHSTTMENEGLQVLYDRCPPLSQRASACGDMAKKLNDRVLDFMPDNFNALWNRILLLNSIGNEADGNAVEEADHIMKILKRIARNTEVMLIAKAEVVGLYTYLKRESETLQNLNQDRQMLYERCPTLSQRVSANDRMLDFSEDNLNAWWNRILLLISTDNYTVDENADVETEEEAEEQHSYENRTKLKILERIVRDTEVMLMAKAEVAGMYTYLEIESESLQNSICLYEAVLAQLGTVSWKTPSDSVLDSLIVFWKQDLLWNYKLLTFKQRHDEALSRAKSLVEDLDQSPVVDPKLKAKAWADLALIYEHHKPTYQNRWPCEMTSTERQPMRKCFSIAMRLDPTNARIRMLAARELRKRVKKESAQLQAIEWFDKSLEGEDVEDIRGVTLFHMGLAYRQLWISDDRPVDDVRVNADLFPSWRNRSSDHPRFDEPPNQPLKFCHIPPPYKTPDDNCSVGWRFLNPIACDPNNTYLLKARRCLQEASETDEERCMFLIELTRTFISTRDIAEARKCLQRAQEDPCSDMVSADFVGVSLYENMAFLEESEMMRTTFNENDTEKIKSLYRESIRQSTKSDWQPVVAFHCLLALLYKQLQTRADEHLPDAAQTIQYTDHNMILQNEYFLLYMAIQKAKESREIVKSYATDDFRIALMWRLIEMFNRRNQPYDAAAAFTYLSILVLADKLTTEVNGINFTAIEKQRMLLLAAERVAEHRVTVAETRYLLPQYRELFDLCGADQEPASASGSASESLSDDEKKKLTIIMKIIEPDLRSCFPCRKERV